MTSSQVIPSVSWATASFQLRDSATASKVFVVVSINKLWRTNDPHTRITIQHIDPIKTRFSLVVGQVLEIPNETGHESLYLPGKSIVYYEMIRFATVPLKQEGILENGVFRVPDSPSTEAVLNNHAKMWPGKKLGCLDPELELYNFVANRWPFITLTSR